GRRRRSQLRDGPEEGQPEVCLRQVSHSFWQPACSGEPWCGVAEVVEPMIVFQMRKYRHLGTALIAIAWIAAGSNYSEPVRSEFYAQDPGKDFSTFKHDNPNHSRLPCLLCHRRETNSAQPKLPGKD